MADASIRSEYVVIFPNSFAEDPIKQLSQLLSNLGYFLFRIFLFSEGARVIFEDGSGKRGCV